MQKGLLVLERDKDLARTRIAELEAEILSLGPEFYEVFNQSSETWHDNAPFEALRDRQSLLDAELRHLQNVLRNSLPSVPKQKSGQACVGATVTVHNSKNNKKFIYQIAGDWSPRTGTTEDNALVISSQSPIAKVLIGKKLGQKVDFNGVQLTVEVLS